MNTIHRLPVFIGIGGCSNIGKTTLGAAIAQRIKQQCIPDAEIHHINFAEPIIEGLQRLDPLIVRDVDGVQVLDHLSTIVEKHGMSHAKKTIPEVRRLLQQYGSEAGRDIHGEDCWINLWTRKVHPIAMQERAAIIVCTDIRTSREADTIRELTSLAYGMSCLIHLKAEGFPPPRHRSTHRTEQCDSDKFDIEITNVYGNLTNTVNAALDFIPQKAKETPIE